MKKKWKTKLTKALRRPYEKGGYLQTSDELRSLVSHPNDRGDTEYWVYDAMDDFEINTLEDLEVRRPGMADDVYEAIREYLVAVQHYEAQAQAHCCLGVMTDILAHEGLMDWRKAVVNPDYEENYEVKADFIKKHGRSKFNVIHSIDEALQEGIIEHDEYLDYKDDGYKYLAWTVPYAEVGMPGHDFYKITGMTLGQAEKLAAMNDDGRTFREIADFIDSPEFEAIR